MVCSFCGYAICDRCNLCHKCSSNDASVEICEAHQAFMALRLQTSQADVPALNQRSIHAYSNQKRDFSSPVSSAVTTVAPSGAGFKPAQASTFQCSKCCHEFSASSLTPTASHQTVCRSCYQSLAGSRMTSWSQMDMYGAGPTNGLTSDVGLASGDGAVSLIHPDKSVGSLNVSTNGSAAVNGGSPPSGTTVQALQSRASLFSTSLNCSPWTTRASELCDDNRTWAAAPGSHLTPKVKAEVAPTPTMLEAGSWWELNQNLMNNNNNINSCHDPKMSSGSKDVGCNSVWDQTPPINGIEMSTNKLNIDLWSPDVRRCVSCNVSVGEVYDDALQCRCCGCRKVLCQMCYGKFQMCHRCQKSTKDCFSARVDDCWAQAVEDPPPPQPPFKMGTVMNKTVGGPVQTSQAPHNGVSRASSASAVPSGATPRGLLRLPKPIVPPDSPSPSCGHASSKPLRFCDPCDRLVCDFCYRQEHQKCDSGLACSSSGSPIGRAGLAGASGSSAGRMGASGGGGGGGSLEMTGVIGLATSSGVLMPGSSGVGGSNGAVGMAGSPGGSFAMANGGTLGMAGASSDAICLAGAVTMGMGIGLAAPSGPQAGPSNNGPIGSPNSAPVAPHSLVNGMSRDSRLRLQSRVASINAMRSEISQRHSQERENIRSYFMRIRRQIGGHEERILQRLDASLQLRHDNLRAQEAELRRRYNEGAVAEADAERAEGPGPFQVWEDSVVEFLHPVSESSALPDPVAQMLAQTRIATSAYVPHCHVVCPREALVFTGKLFAFHVHLKDHMRNAVELRNTNQPGADGTGGLGEMRAWAVVLQRGRPTREVIPASVSAYHTVGHYAVSLQSPRRSCELMVHCRLRGQDLPNTPMRWRVEESRDYRRLATAAPIHVVGSGEPSNQPGQFNRPWGIACDDQGYLVISDRANGRIQILRPDFSVERVFGQQGSGDGDLQKPAGVAVHPVNRHIYVVDKDNHRIVVYNWQGEFLFRWGRRGTQRGEFFYPWDLAIDPSGQRLVVTDSRNHRLQFFRTNGDFIGEYQMESVVMNLPQPNLAAAGRMLDQPRGITFIDQTRLVVTDFQTHRLCVIRMDGSTAQVSYIGGEGSDLGRFVRPQCVASDREGNLVVTESRSGRVQVLDNAMRAQLAFGSPGSEPGQFNRPAGVCFTPQRRLVIVDSENHRVIVYSLE